MVVDYDLIIFDCDGTLVDTEYLNNKVVSDILTAIGLDGYTPDKCLIEFSGSSWAEMKHILDARHNISLSYDSVVEDFTVGVQREMETYLKSIEGALDFVRSCCNDNYKIAVGSNGERPNVIRSLSLEGFDDCFSEETIFTKSQVKNAKPAPDLFLLAAEKMGVSSNRCLVIEDSFFGAKAGVTAGMDVFGFIGASHDKKTAQLQLKKAGACKIFDDFIHIANWLKL